MIVVDTNLLAYVVIPGEHTEAARRAYVRDPAWAAPVLWRSEFRNVLAGYLRRETIATREAADLFAGAAAFVAGREFEADADDVLELVARSRCSAYDCEFVAVARDLGAPLVTSDQDLLDAFPRWTIPLDAFGAEC